MTYDDALELPRDEDGRVVGYQIGGTRAHGIAEWLEAKDEREFKKLIDRLYARKWWKNLDAEQRARVVAYRKQWAKDHPERWREMMRRAKAKRRKSGATAAEARARRAKKRAERRARTVYVCHRCGARWSPVGRIPARTPKWCGVPCRSAAQYRRVREHDRGRVPEPAGYGERVRSVLALDGELTTDRLMAELGLTRRYAQRVLVEMTSRGHLVRVGRGRYLAASEAR